MAPRITSVLLDACVKALSLNGRIGDGWGDCGGPDCPVCDQRQILKKAIAEASAHLADGDNPLQVIDRLNAAGWEVTIVVSPRGGVVVNLERFNTDNGCTEKTGAGHGSSLAFALSLAALRAEGADV